MADNNPRTLTVLERLQLANQFAILEELVDENEKDHYAKCREIMESGYTIMYGEVFQGISDELPQDYCEFVFDVLDMHRDLMTSFEQLKDKESIDPSQVNFRGFDGNNESELMGFLTFLKGQGRWSETLEKCPLNSHFPTVDRYQAMLRNWKPIRDKYKGDLGTDWHNLTAEEIKQVLDWKNKEVNAS